MAASEDIAPWQYSLSELSQSIISSVNGLTMLEALFTTGVTIALGYTFIKSLSGYHIRKVLKRMREERKDEADASVEALQSQLEGSVRYIHLHSYIPCSY